MSRSLKLNLLRVCSAFELPSGMSKASFRARGAGASRSKFFFAVARSNLFAKAVRNLDRLPGNAAIPFVSHVIT